MDKIKFEKGKFYRCIDIEGAKHWIGGLIKLSDGLPRLCIEGGILPKFKGIDYNNTSYEYNEMEEYEPKVGDKVKLLGTKVGEKSENWELYFRDTGRTEGHICCIKNIESPTTLSKNLKRYFLDKNCKGNQQSGYLTNLDFEIVEIKGEKSKLKPEPLYKVGDTVECIGCLREYKGTSWNLHRKDIIKDVIYDNEHKSYIYHLIRYPGFVIEDALMKLNTKPKFQINEKVKCINSDKYKGAGWSLDSIYIINKVEYVQFDGKYTYLYWFEEEGCGVYEHALELFSANPSLELGIKLHKEIEEILILIDNEPYTFVDTNTQIKNEENKMNYEKLEEPKTEAQKIAKKEAVQDAIDKIVAKEKQQYEDAIKTFMNNSKEISRYQEHIDKLQETNDNIITKLKLTKAQVERLQ